MNNNEKNKQNKKANAEMSKPWKLKIGLFSRGKMWLICDKIFSGENNFFWPKVVKITKHVNRANSLRKPQT